MTRGLLETEEGVAGSTSDDPCQLWGEPKCGELQCACVSCVLTRVCAYAISVRLRACFCVCEIMTMYGPVYVCASAPLYLTFITVYIVISVQNRLLLA